MIHSARPLLSQFRLILKFWDEQTDRPTTCVKIVIKTVAVLGLVDQLYIEISDFPSVPTKIP